MYSSADPNSRKGVEISAIPGSDMLLEHVGNQPALLARRGHELFAVGAISTHYGAPLIGGLVVGVGKRRPWRHEDFERGDLAKSPPTKPKLQCRVH